MDESIRDLTPEDVAKMSMEEIESVKTQILDIKTSIDTQLASRKADIESKKNVHGRVPRQDFADFSTWRARAIAAKRKAEVALRLLKEEKEKRRGGKPPAHLDDSRAWVLFAALAGGPQKADELLIEYRKRFKEEA